MFDERSVEPSHAYADNGPARYPDLAAVVGRTPIIQLANVKPRTDCTLLLKLESMNPGGSVKDRPAAYIIQEAERTGLLAPGGTIIESSSGNFGISLAMIGAARGYRVIILVDPKTMRSKLAVLRALGAEIVVVTEKDETGSYHKARIRMANEMAAQIRGAFRPDQCSNPLNAEAHYHATAVEIIEQTGGQLDVIVIPTSTGGQLAGIAGAIRERRLPIKVVAADVRGSGIFREATRPYYTPGMGMAWTPINIVLDQIDAVHLVRDEDAFTGARLLSRMEGLLCGGSTGTVLQVMIYHACRQAGARVLGIQADAGDHYLDTIYSDMWLEERGLRSDIMLDEFFERSRRNAPLPLEELQYHEPDAELVPPDWLCAALDKRKRPGS